MVRTHRWHPDLGGRGRKHRNNLRLSPAIYEFRATRMHKPLSQKAKQRQQKTQNSPILYFSIFIKHISELEYSCISPSSLPLLQSPHAFFCYLVIVQFWARPASFTVCVSADIPYFCQHGGACPFLITQEAGASWIQNHSGKYNENLFLKKKKKKFSGL